MMGLDIAKRLTEIMGGKIGVNSQPGKGSVFWIEFPVQEVVAAVKPGDDTHATTDHPPEELTGKRILVAEDNQANQLIARLSLEKVGMVVDIASNGLEAVKAVSERPYDIVFMDIGMPEMSGQEAAKEIREKLGIRDLPIIACTAHSMSSDFSGSKLSCFNDYLAKPITRENMLAILVKWVLQHPATSSPATANPASGEPQSETLLDRATLSQLAEDLGSHYLDEAVNALKSEINSRLAGIASAGDDKRYDEVARQAHALKSGALSFGARRLGTLLSEVESLATQNNELVWSLLDQLTAVGQSTLDALDNPG